MFTEKAFVRKSGLFLPYILVYIQKEMALSMASNGRKKKRRQHQQSRGVLLFGATGGCGSQVLTRLLRRGVLVTAVVRSAERLSDDVKSHDNLTVVVFPNGHLFAGTTRKDDGKDDGNALNDSFTRRLDRYVRECECVVSCLGHNLTLKGMFGRPRQLCVETVRQVCDAVARQKGARKDIASSEEEQKKEDENTTTNTNNEPLRLIVVSTEGVSRFDGADPKRGALERALLKALYFLLPPMKDNVEVVRFLHELKETNETSTPSHRVVEFCAVRPSDMRDGEESPHEAHAELQNGLFDAGNTTRANVGAFIADLVTKPETWARWRNAFPHLLDSK